MDIRIKKSIERINQIIDELPVENPKQFSEILEFKRPERIYKILRGETAISKNLAKIINEKYPQYSVEWLLTGEDPTVKDEDPKPNPNEQYRNSPNEKNIPEGVPYYDIDFTLSFVGVENTQQVNPDTYVTHPFFAGCDYIVRASGQSMAKIIKHGDAIGLTRIDNWQEFIPLGEVYAIVTKNGFRMVKVITKGKDDEHFKLVSKPSDSKKDEFPDQQIRKSNIIQIYRVQASSHLF